VILRKKGSLLVHIQEISGIFDQKSLNEKEGRFREMRNLFSVVSFIMAVIGGMAAMFSAHRDRQTMASIVGIAFLISFFINVDKGARLILQGACLIAFATAVLGGGVAIFTSQHEKRTGGIVTGIVALGTSLVILFLYLDFYLP
jgi:hypothetical protein